MIPTGVLRKAMHDIAAKKGDFTLFALFLRANAPGTWDLVVSAPWLESGKLKATGELVQLLAESIGKESLRHFARVATVPAGHPTVKFILENLPVDDGERRVRSTDLFGLQTEEAIIFCARRLHANKPANKALHPTPPASSRSRA